MTPNEKNEFLVQQQIYTCIDNFDCFRFNAGAGAGKTYALIESIRYILKNNAKSLQKSNQKITCVTYTNVAVEEIKKRLGNSEIVNVSTIHERLWELVKPYQKELVQCHKEKIEVELKSIIDDLRNKSDDKFKVFANLSQEEKIAFIQFAFETKDVFYRVQNAKSGAFKKAYAEVADEIKPSSLAGMIKNFSNFKSTIRYIYKKARYSDCLEKINSGKNNSVVYDHRFNNDRLASMMFSHDTLLEYCLMLVERHPMLCRIIIDQSPYFFIDEYQDADEKVIKLVKCLDNYKATQSKRWMVGYFGDVAQNIYDKGIGSRIYTIHPEITNINKEYNRRSHTQIIDLINLIRNDKILQKPIYEDRASGDIQLHHSGIYNSTDEKVEATIKFLEGFKTDLSEKTEIHCLVLTNKLMAQLNGFGDIYNCFANADSIFHEDLKTQLLSNELEKLNPVILQVYKFLDLYQLINSPRTTYENLFGSLANGVTFADAKKVVCDLKAINSGDLNEFIGNISQLLEKENKNKALDCCISHTLNIDRRLLTNFNNINALIILKLTELMSRTGELTDEEADIARGKVDTVLSIPINQWILWKKFIDKVHDSDISYHTYHGTKGEEYQNVAIIMEHSFGGTYKGRDKLKNFFNHLQLEGQEKKQKLEDSKYKDDFENTKNLIYVACSRAIKSLRVLYLDDISSIEKGIEQIFTNPIEFKMGDKK
ncbi:UvrD-helicase domain-containing protein [Pseudoalteromonas sp. ECSMB14103]|uniref:UvrD-helicase domain-containing protein n=1 Tax=Pseudoalteromonas sp. ECSMB14103 TaxID=1580062 RepID=UPI00068ABB11|nr:UvrD-helicase domain-containing protein [Pseudoalteromonas sp. ECSMB14103]